MMYCTIFVVLSLASVRLGVTAYDLRNGCPKVVYDIPRHTYWEYDKYDWYTFGEKVKSTNEVVRYYDTYKNGNLTVALCYKFHNVDYLKPRKSIPEDIRQVVKMTCIHDCDAGHLLPARFGGLDIITNIIPQQSSLNRGPWNGFEDSIAKYGVDSTIVLIVLEYNARNDLHMKFNTELIQNLIVRHPAQLRTVSFSDSVPSIIHACGTFKNDGRVPMGVTKNIGMTTGKWAAKSLPPGNYAECG